MVQEALNIWGKAGCDLPDGSKCQVCCIGYQIIGDNGLFISGNQEHCPLSKASDPKNIGWCNRYETRPRMCAQFHCSDLNLSAKQALLYVAFCSGLIDYQTIEVNLAKLLS